MFLFVILLTFLEILITLDETAVHNILNTDDDLLSQRLWIVANLICEVYLDFEKFLMQDKVIF
jgi:hypothetical protein